MPLKHSGFILITVSFALVATIGCDRTQYHGQSNAEPNSQTPAKSPTEPSPTPEQATSPDAPDWVDTPETLPKPACIQSEVTITLDETPVPFVLNTIDLPHLEISNDALAGALISDDNALLQFSSVPIAQVTTGATFQGTDFISALTSLPIDIEACLGGENTTLTIDDYDGIVGNPMAVRLEGQMQCGSNTIHLSACFVDAIPEPQWVTDGGEEDDP